MASFSPAPHAPSPDRFPLQRQARDVPWAFVVAVLVAILSSAVGFHLWRQEVLHNAGVDGAKRLQGVARVLDSPRASIEAALDELADMVEPLRAGQLPVKRANQDLRHIESLIPAVRTAVVFDASGTVVAASRDSLLGGNFKGRAYFAQALKQENTGLTLLSEPYLGVLGVWVVNVTRTVYDEQGRLLGVVSLTLSPDFLGLALDLGSASTREYRALLHPGGKVMVDHETSGVLRARLLRGDDRTLDLPDVLPLASRRGGDETFTSRTVVTEGTDGALVQTLWMPWGLPGTGQGWVMLSVQPLDDLLRPWRAGLGIAILSFLVIFGAAGAAMQFAAARHLRRVRRLQQAYRVRQREEDLARRQSARRGVTMSVAKLAGWTVEWPSGIVTCSEELIELYGVRQTPLVTLEDMQGLHLPRTLVQEVQSSIRDRRRFDLDVQWDDALGAERWFQLAGGPAIDTGHGTLVLECVAMDITHRVLSQRAADAQRQGFEAALRQSRHLEAIGTLAGGVAHDFNNLLGIVLVNARELQAQWPATHAAQSALDHIIESCLIGRSHVERIQAFSANRSAMREHCDLGILLSRTADLLRATVPARIQIRVLIVQEGLFSHADVRQLQQVILNLASNAQQAMEAQPAGLLTLSLAPVEGDQVELCCSDTGCGMSDEVAQRALEPFFTTRPAGRGAGLGLSLAHAFAREHRGSLEIRTALGQGTTIRILLPRSPAQVVARPEPTTPTAPGDVACEDATRSVAQAGSSVDSVQAEGTGAVGAALKAALKAAIVDDNRLMRFAVERQLKRLGHQVELYASGPELLAALEQDALRVDVVLTDFNLPEMSGLEVIQALRARWPAVKAILYSGYVVEDVQRRALELGAVAVLRKEDTAEQLPEIIEGLRSCALEAVV